MRHLKKGKKFHRIRGRRISFLKNLANDLIKKNKIETTEARAKAIKPIVEKLVTIAKEPTLHNRRLLLSRTGDKKVVERLLNELGPRYKERKGGYLRILKSAKSRKRDGALVSVIEFI